jgi:hypothetical protein
MEQFAMIWIIGVIIVKFTGQSLADKLRQDYGNLSSLYYASKGMPITSPKAWVFALAWPISVAVLGISQVKALTSQQGRSASINDPEPPPIGWAGTEQRRETAREAKAAHAEKPPEPPDEIRL